MTTTNDNDIEVPFLERKLDGLNGPSTGARPGLSRVGGANLALKSSSIVANVLFILGVHAYPCCRIGRSNGLPRPLKSPSLVMAAGSHQLRSGCAAHGVLTLEVIAVFDGGKQNLLIR